MNGCVDPKIAQVNAQLTSAAAEINFKCPILNEYDRVDSCKYIAQTTSLNFYLTIIVDISDESPTEVQAVATQVKTEITEIIKKSNKYNDKFATFIKSAKITLKYFYENNKGKKLFEISITPEEYQR